MLSLLNSFFDSPHERVKHIVASETLPSIEAEGVLVQICLQIFGADVVRDAANPILCQTPEAFNRVRVRIPAHVDVCRMMDAPVVEAHRTESFIEPCLIGKDDR